jgi:CRP/FNR family transcriptional regulator, cyclic AMP receptor protein
MTSSPRDLEQPAAPVTAAEATAAASESPAVHAWSPAQAGARRPPRVAPASSRTDVPDPFGDTSHTVCLLDVEPDLGRGIESQDWEAARHAARATVMRVESGEPALPPATSQSAAVVGLIVNEGMISREIALGEHVAFELLSPGNVLLPPAGGTDDLELGGPVILTALSAAELIVLGTRFIDAAAHWPSLLTNLHRRLEAQRRRLALQTLAAHLPRAEDRVLLTIWILAYSCGRVTPDGIVLPLSLSHEVLGRLAAARRPTVTLALRSLESDQSVLSRPNGHLTLGPEADRRVKELADVALHRPPIGPSVARHQPLGRTPRSFAENIKWT